MMFVNENRERVEIIVRTILDYHGNCRYVVEDVHVTPYRKRNPISMAAQIWDRYEYRVLDRDARAEYTHQEFLKHCTEEQLWEAVQEAYRQMAPTKESVEYR